MPLKCHNYAICQNYIMRINGKVCQYIYTTYELNGINCVAKSTIHRPRRRRGPTALAELAIILYRI